MRVIVKRDFKEFQFQSIVVTCSHGIAPLSGRRGCGIEATSHTLLGPLLLYHRLL